MIIVAPPGGLPGMGDEVITSGTIRVPPPACPPSIRQRPSTTRTRPCATRRKRQRIDAVLDREHARRERLRRVVVMHRHRALRDDRPGSISGTTKCTVAPWIFDAGRERAPWVSRPWKAGSREGWMLSIRPSQRPTKPGRQQPHEAGEADELDAGARSTASSARSKRFAVLAEVACDRRPRSRCRRPRAVARPAASGRLETTSAISAG